MRVVAQFEDIDIGLDAAIRELLHRGGFVPVGEHARRRRVRQSGGDDGDPPGLGGVVRHVTPISPSRPQAERGARPPLAGVSW